MVVQGEQLGKANETAAGNQKRESFTIIPVTPKGLIQGSPYSHGMYKNGTETAKVVPKRKRAWEDSNPGITKGGSIHG